MPNSGPEGYRGWIIGRITQEHGILTQEKGEGEALEVGQKVKIWPNHACIAGAGYGWYLVVDSEREGCEDQIVDVWVRCRGW
jgi:D-serine deaminase-like pyridoxal phosphate-dependent protein